MKISFVILNYNREKELLITVGKTMELMAGKSDYEIIVVDNASSDNSIISLSRAYPEVRILARSKNIGIAGWNDGFELAKGEYLVVLDDDSNIVSGLDEAIAVLDDDPKIGILALNVTGGAFPTDYLVHMEDNIDFIGCGAIIRKTLFEKIGGFAEWLFIYTHEWEYAIRCLDAGFSIRYFAHCYVDHRTSVINRSSRRLKVFSIRNEMAIVYKFFDKKDRSKYVTRVYLNNLKSIRRLGPAALPWFYQALVEFMKLRKELVHTPVSREVQDFYSKSCWSTRRFLKII
ncbi:glycosyl transferase [Pedobacter quisquiliarum]|jgi:GT2 family glycosyltransferase|uniref:Glycosyl transferase n=1 Tax=Pedobacter quisquiliarum TaxID=1834438 RepID=A0A916TXW7_9SPHI|nr:glycosyltransferase [Pedobacter quisquiliarum]GGC51195.1 glycosyl transferase [Pedobacter quisquiliarum]